MAVGVVDGLETVEVDKQQRDLVAAALAMDNGLLHAILEQQPVGQAGEGSWWARKAILASAALRSLMSEKIPTRWVTRPSASRTEERLSHSGNISPLRRLFQISPFQYPVSRTLCHMPLKNSRLCLPEASRLALRPGDLGAGSR
jgi:hypothetical protein